MDRESIYAIDQRELDRLVDGELSDREFQDLLRRVERGEDGWRRCALAFLEDQALRRDLLGVSKEDSLGPRATLPPQPARTTAPSGAWALAAVACFFGAMMLNWSPWQPPRGAEARPAPNLAAQAGPDARPLDQHPVPNTLVHDAAPQPSGVVPLLVNSGARQQEIPLPYYDGPEGLQALGLPESLPPELTRLLQQVGGQVRVDRAWAPVQLDDGGQVLFPVDRYQFLPVRSH